MEKTFTWTTADGLNIFAKDWSIDQPKAVIALIHGLGEHCSRYHHMATYYNDRGYAMMSFDHRGHGQSDGPRGHIPNYAAYLDGVDQLMEAISRHYPDVPVILYGHSMGGNIALNYAIQRKPKLQAVVATGSWILLPKAPSSLLILFAKLMNTVYPTFAQGNGLQVEHISRLQDEVRKYANDPLVHDRITVGFGMHMLEAAKKLLHYKDQFPYPLLLQHGGDDQITSPKGSQQFARQAKGDITLKIWDGLYHEIHNENIREQIFDYTIQWISDKL